MSVSHDHSADGWRAARRRLSSVDPVLGGVIRATGPCTLIPGFTGAPFNHLTHAIAHQQLNGTAAKTILKRFLAIYGDAEHPTPEQVLTTDPRRLRAAGLSLGKIAAIRDLAARVLDGTVPTRGADLESLSDQEIIERLTTVRNVRARLMELSAGASVQLFSALSKEGVEEAQNAVAAWLGITHKKSPGTRGESGAHK